MTMCDFCRPVADHDKPYVFDELLTTLQIRFTRAEIKRLYLLRLIVQQTRLGELQGGPAVGDIHAGDS